MVDARAEPVVTTALALYRCPRGLVSAGKGIVREELARYVDMLIDHVDRSCNKNQPCVGTLCVAKSSDVADGPNGAANEDTSTTLEGISRQFGAKQGINILD